MTVGAKQTVAVPMLAVTSELKRPDDMKQFESSLSVVPLVAVETPGLRITHQVATSSGRTGDLSTCAGCTRRRGSQPASARRPSQSERCSM